jgi:hypothetical protein
MTHQLASQVPLTDTLACVYRPPFTGLALLTIGATLSPSFVDSFIRVSCHGDSSGSLACSYL